MRLCWSALILFCTGALLFSLAAQATASQSMRQADGTLPPAAEPYQLGFADPNAVAENWLDQSGDWTVQNQRYVQGNAFAANAASLYRLGIADDYSIEVKLTHETGQSGGVIINAAANDALALANVVRYNHTASALEIREIQGDGSFRQIGAVSTGIPQDDLEHTLRIEVDAERFRVLFDDTEVGDYRLSNRPAVAYVGVYTNQASFAFADFTAEVGTEEAVGGDLNPQTAPHLFGFLDPADLDLWLPGQGEWVFGDPGYVQNDPAAEASFTYYNGRINGDFTLDVTLNLVAGEMSGGLLFNAAGNGSLADTLLVAFDPNAEESGGAIYWGAFDAVGEFQELGRADVSAPPDDQADRDRRLTVTLTGDEYTIAVDGEAVGDVNTLPAASPRVAGPYFGLYASAARVRFSRVAVTVTESEVATPTPIVPTDTPTITPSPTATTPPPAGSLLPSADPYVFDFGNMTEDEEARWSIERGAWSFDDNGYTQTDIFATDAMAFYDFQVFGDYELEAKLIYAATGEIPSEAGAGVIFNAPNLDINEAFIAAYRRDESQSSGAASQGRTNFTWGYFRNGVFRRVSQAGVASTPLQNDTVRTIRIKVEGDVYSVWLDDTQWVNNRTFRIENSDGTVEHDTERVDEAYIGLYATRGVVRFEELTVTVSNYANPTPTPTSTSPPTPTRGPTPTPDSAALPQNSEPYLIGFSADQSGEADSISNWNQVQGEWRYDQGFVVDSQEVQDYFSIYNRPIGQVPAGGDYTVEVTAQFLDGEMGAGLIFNAPDRTSIDRTTLLRFNPDPSAPAAPQIEWGYYSGGVFRAINRRTAPDPGQVKTDAYRLRASVTSDRYSLWINDEQIVDSQFLDPEGRHLQPFVGVYASGGRVRFTDARVTISEQNLPTPTVTPTSPPVNPTRTPTRTQGPTRTPTPTPTFTPSSPTPTNTLPPSPTLTNTPIVVAAAPMATATPVLAISTPQPPTPSQLQLTQTAIAATATTVASVTQAANATATAQSGFDQQTTTAVAQSPLTTPTAALSSPTALPAPQNPTQPPAIEEPPNNQAALPVIVVTNTPPPTQRPIDPATPTPTPAPVPLLAQVLASTLRAAFWVWFVIGSIIFFAVAGLVFGLSMSRQAGEPYALLDGEETDDLETLALQLDGTERDDVANHADRTDGHTDDNWPASLP